MVRSLSAMTVSFQVAWMTMWLLSQGVRRERVLGGLAPVASPPPAILARARRQRYDRGHRPTGRHRGEASSPYRDAVNKGKRHGRRRLRGARVGLYLPWLRVMPELTRSRLAPPRAAPSSTSASRTTGTWAISPGPVVACQVMRTRPVLPVFFSRWGQMDFVRHVVCACM